MQQLKSIRSLIIDMDGVLYHGDRPVHGLVPLFQFLHERNIQYLLATNNSTLTPDRYAEKLSRMGVEVPPDCILTSSLATAQYLQKHYPKGAHVYALGENGLKEALQEAGFVLDDQQASAVVAGLDRDLTYDKLKRATLLIRAGADFVGTNGDKTLPVPEGLVPGAGSVLAALEAAAGIQPLVIGKPEPHLYTIALERLGTPKESTAAVGDRLETDILGAKRLGLFAILVLSGVSTREEAQASADPPDLIFQDVGELAERWSELLSETH